MMCDVLVCRDRRSENRIQRMPWKVDHSDIVFVNAVGISSLLVSNEIAWTRNSASILTFIASVSTRSQYMYRLGEFIGDISLLLELLTFGTFYPMM